MPRSIVDDARSESPPAERAPARSPPRLREQRQWQSSKLKTNRNLSHRRPGQDWRPKTTLVAASATAGPMDERKRQLQIARRAVLRLRREQEKEAVLQSLPQRFCSSCQHSHESFEFDFGKKTCQACLGACVVKTRWLLANMNHLLLPLGRCSWALQERQSASRVTPIGGRGNRRPCRRTTGT